MLEWAFFNISFSIFSLKKKIFFTMSFFYFWPPWEACGILVSQLGIKPWPVAMKALSPNHWNIREFPKMWLFESSFGKNGDIGFHPDLTSPLLSTWTLCSVPKPTSPYFLSDWQFFLRALHPHGARSRLTPCVSHISRA